MRIKRIFVSIALAVLPAAGQIANPTPVPFTTVGFIQNATIDTASDPLSGGSMTVNGLVITIPRNTILQMPATAISWGDVFALAPEPFHSAGQSGLALLDSPKPLTTYEVTVYGNRIGPGTSSDRYVAGLISVSQQSLNSAQGLVNYVDYGRGELRVGGVPGDASTGACRSE